MYRTTLALLVLVGTFGCGPESDDAVVTDTAALTQCGGGKVDLRSDSNNCGRCGQACGPKGVCTEGRCAARAQCGGSGQACCRRGACGEGLTCQSGTCQPAASLCAAGDVQCGSVCCGSGSAGFAGCSADGQSCGCGGSTELSVCATSTPNRFTCENVFRNADNCGACGVTCAATESCLFGTCTSFTTACAAGETQCGSLCCDPGATCGTNAAGFAECHPTTFASCGAGELECGIGGPFGSEACCPAGQTCTIASGASGNTAFCSVSGIGGCPTGTVACGGNTCCAGGTTCNPNGGFCQ